MTSMDETPNSRSVNTVSAASAKRCKNRSFGVAILAYPGTALLVGALVRLLGLGAKSLWLDEILSVRAAQADLSQFVSGAIERYHPPLYFVLLGRWMGLGDSNAHLRLLSVACGIAAVGLTAVLARALFGSDVANTAAWLAATSPLLVWYSQEVRDYSLLMAFVLLGQVGMTRMLLAPRSYWWLLFVVGTVGGLYTHYVAVVALFLQLFLAVGLVATRRASPRSLGLVLLGWVAAALAFLPWLKTPAAQAFLDQLSSDRFYVDVLTVGQGYLPDGMMGFVEDRATRLMLYGGLLVVVLVGVAVIMLTRLLRRHDDWLVKARELTATRVALICAHLVLLVLAVIPRGYTVKRYSLVLWPTVLILYAWVWPWLRRNKTILGCAVALSLSASILNVLVVPKAQWDRAAHLVLSQQQQNDVTVLSPSYMTLTFGYYAEDRVPMAVVRGSDASSVDATLAELSADYDRVWFVSHTTDVGRHQAAIGQWLAENARCASKARLYRIDVQLCQVD